MSDYAKKKNDELAALCKERGLPHTGKKAELVKRLEDHDQNSSTGAAPESKPAAASDQKDTKIEANAEPRATQSAQATTSGTTGTSDAVKAEQGVPKGEAQDGEGAEAKAPAQDFSLGLQERTLDEEIEKRRKRAEKFGLDPKQDETLKQLERAKRFGTTNLPGLLNQALPERGEKQSKKRGRENQEDNKDNRKRSRQRTDKADKPASKSEAADGKYPTWMTDKDREAAERRKAKYGAPKE